MKYDDLFRLDGKTALITGSSRGIGRAIAEAMVAQGAQVVISSRKADACERTAEEIEAEGGRAVAIPCNISHKEQLQELVAGTRRAFGRIDILVCNAAVNPHYGPMSTLPDDAYEKTMGANVRSNLWLCNMVIPEMAERKDGAVIIVSSVAGLKGTSAIGVYALSKAADMQLARNLACEWGPQNIRVNCIAPGLIATDFARALYEDPKRRAAAEARFPLRRLGVPDDIGGIAVMLAGRAGAFITGQSIVADGGATITG
jgi:NAD(P)-dependent dehydrogenase (short-subunit alcohol dehydrogenase family)